MKYLISLLMMFALLLVACLPANGVIVVTATPVGNVRVVTATPTAGVRVVTATPIVPTEPSGVIIVTATPQPVDPTPTREISPNPHSSCAENNPSNPENCQVSANPELDGPYTTEEIRDANGERRVWEVPGRLTIVNRAGDTGVQPTVFCRDGKCEFSIDSVDPEFAGYSTSVTGYQRQRYLLKIVLESDVFYRDNPNERLVPGDIEVVWEAIDASDGTTLTMPAEAIRSNGEHEFIRVLQLDGRVDDFIVNVGLRITHPSLDGVVIFDAIRVLAIPPTWGEGSEFVLR